VRLGLMHITRLGAVAIDDAVDGWPTCLCAHVCASGGHNNIPGVFSLYLMNVKFILRLMILKVGLRYVSVSQGSVSTLINVI